MRFFFSLMTSCAVHYDVIYHPFPINSQYLKTCGVDSPEITQLSCSQTSSHCRRNSTPVSNICEAVPKSLFSAPNRLNELLEMLFKFPFILIGKSTMAILTGQLWHVLKSWYTGGGPEQLGFQCCFAAGLNQCLVSSVLQATDRHKYWSSVYC